MSFSLSKTGSQAILTYFQSSHWCLTACILSSVNSCWEVALNTLKYTANSIHKRQTFCYCQACKLRNDSMIMCLKHFFRLFSSYTGSILTNLSLKLFFNTVVYSWHDVWSDSSKKKPETVEKVFFSSWEFRHPHHSNTDCRGVFTAFHINS